eukprot:g3185.t1
MDEGLIINHNYVPCNLEQKGVCGDQNVPHNFLYRRLGTYASFSGLEYYEEPPEKFIERNQYAAECAMDIANLRARLSILRSSRRHPNAKAAKVAKEKRRKNEVEMSQTGSKDQEPTNHSHSSLTSNASLASNASSPSNGKNLNIISLTSEDYDDGMKDNEEKFIESQLSKEFMKCYYCRVSVHISSRHCRTCDKCVPGFDHHCRWLNNCIGSNNYRAFFATVLVTFLLVVIQLIAGLLVSIYSSNWSLRSTGIAFAILAFILVASIGQLLGFHVMLFFTNHSTYSYVNLMSEKREKRRKQRRLQRKKAKQLAAAAKRKKKKKKKKTVAGTGSKTKTQQQINDIEKSSIDSQIDDDQVVGDEEMLEEEDDQSDSERFELDVDYDIEQGGIIVGHGDGSDNCEQDNGQQSDDDGAAAQLMKGKNNISGSETLPVNNYFSSDDENVSDDDGYNDDLGFENNMSDKGRHNASEQKNIMSNDSSSFFTSTKMHNVVEKPPKEKTSKEKARERLRRRRQRTIEKEKQKTIIPMEETYAVGKELIDQGNELKDHGNELKDHGNELKDHGKALIDHEAVPSSSGRADVSHISDQDVNLTVIEKVKEDEKEKNSNYNSISSDQEEEEIKVLEFH